MSRASVLAAAEKADSSSGRVSKAQPLALLESGRSIGSDNTASTVSTTSSESSNVVDSDHMPHTGSIRSSYDAPVGEPLGGDSSSSGSSRNASSQRPRTDNPWAPKIASNPSSSNRRNSTSRSGPNSDVANTRLTTTETPRLRRSRSNEDGQNADRDHAASAATTAASVRNVFGDDDLKTMTEGVAERRARRAAAKAREGAQQHQRPADAGACSRSSAEEEEIDQSASSYSSSSARPGGRSSSRRDALSEQQRSRSAPASNRSLVDFDDMSDAESADRGYQKRIRWSDNHGRSLEEVHLLDPQRSEGGILRAEKRRLCRRASYDDDEVAQYDSDESTDSSEEYDDHYDDQAEESMVFDLKGGPAFSNNENIDLADMADTSLSLDDAISGTIEEDEEKEQNVAQQKSGNQRLRRYGRKRDDVQQQEGSMSLTDLAGALDTVSAVTADEPEPAVGTSACFGEVSMDLSEISAELNDELQQLPLPEPPSRSDAHKNEAGIISLPKRSIMEDSMNVFPDPELVSARDRAINAIDTVSGNNLPVPTSVVVETDQEKRKPTLPLETLTKKKTKNNKFNEKWMDSMAAVKDGEPLMTDDDLFGEHNQQRFVGPMGDISVIELKKVEEGVASNLPASPPAENFLNFEGKVNYGKVSSTRNLNAQPPARRNRRSSNSSPVSSPTLPKPVSANPHHGFDDFARWGNDSFEANTAPSYLAKKSKEKHQHHMGKKPSSSPSARPSRPERPSVKPRQPQPRPPMGLAPSRQHQLHHQHQHNQQQVRRSPKQDTQKRSHNTGSDTPRSTPLAVEKAGGAARKSSSKGKSMFGGLFGRGSLSRGQPKKMGDDEIAFIAHADESLGDSLASFGDLAGLDSYYDPNGGGLAASIARSSQQQQQQRRRDSMKGRSLDDSDALLFAHIKDGHQRNSNDSLEDLFDREMVRELRGLSKGQE